MLAWKHAMVVLMLFAGCSGDCGRRRGAAPAVERPPELVAIDIFGTKQITREQLLAKQERQLRAFVADSLSGGAPVAAWLEDDIHELGDFAHVSLALVGYYEPDGMKYYLTVDFVDRSDAARRMSFAPAPTGTYEDPEGLIADWKAYEAKVHELMSTKQLSPVRIDCPAFHCLGDPAHPELRPFVDRFVALVPDHVAELATILQDEQDPRHRDAAVFLLAYMKDGPSLVKMLVPALRDGDMLVRNNALRVIADIAFFHPEVEIPVEPVVAALEDPETLGRNKAAAILEGLLERPGSAHLHEPITQRAGATLYDMLRLEQPNNHDFAYEILKAISGQSYGERDYAAWQAWLEAARTPHH